MTVAHVVAVDAPALAPVVAELAAVAAAAGAEHVHHGLNTAPPEFVGAALLGLVALFEDLDALQAYLDDPAHVAAAEKLGGAAVITVIDLERTLA